METKKHIIRASEVDFKVEGPWDTEKYCRPPWLSYKKICEF